MNSSSEPRVVFGRTPRLLRGPNAWTWNRRPGDSLPRRELERIEREAFERGRDEERRRLRDAHDALRSAHEKTVALEHERQATLEPEVVELALHVAERLVGETVREGRHDVAKIVRDALRGLRGIEERRTIHLNPSDLDTLRAVELPGETEVDYRADAEVPRGSCRIVTPYGHVVRDLELLQREIGQRLRARAGQQHRHHTTRSTT